MSLFSGIALCCLLVVGCGESAKPKDIDKSGSGSTGSATTAQVAGKPKRTPFPVTVQPVAGATIELLVSATGTVEAFETVAVTARVAGVVEKVAFREGDSVAADSVLVEIEPERYRLARDAAKAARDEATADLDEARQGLERRERLIREQPDQVRAEEVATWRTRVAASDAAVARNTANLGTAELNLRDATVRPPLAGIVQTRGVRTGAYVQVGAVLATLVRRDPLLLRFSVTAEEAARLKLGMEVRFTVPGDTADRSARITFIAAAADSAARMVEVLAEVRSGPPGGREPGKSGQTSGSATAAVSGPPGGTGSATAGSATDIATGPDSAKPAESWKPAERDKTAESPNAAESARTAESAKTGESGKPAEILIPAEAGKTPAKDPSAVGSTSGAAQPPAGTAGGERKRGSGKSGDRGGREGTGDALVPGAFASVRVVVGTRPDVPAVPETALRSTDRGYQVLVVESSPDGDLARTRPVRIGLRTSDGRVEIRSGLAIGDPLVIGGAEAISNGSRVVVKAASPAPSTPAGSASAAPPAAPAPR
ncbi:hypothetical protein LBMAG53_03180 [Planctomycetota bacterium]|nr:hypothetical protein LBMAG53_03180 [Planctomycetota bacterium]